MIISRQKRYQPLPGKTFADYGILVPIGTSGEVRTRCPQCSAHRRKKGIRCLAVNLTEGVWLCHHCGWSGALHQGQKYLSAPPPPPPAEPASAQGKRIIQLRTTWKTAYPLDHAEAEPARAYLSHRGLQGIFEDLPADIRLHPALPYWDQSDDGQWRQIGSFPALVALVRGPDGMPVSIHRTYLRADGKGKAKVTSAKKLMSPIIPGTLLGAAVRLYPATEQLVVGEGIETVLAVRVATGLPVWSALFADSLAALAIPECVTELFIAADHDSSRKGEIVAFTLLRRIKKTRPDTTVKVVMPPFAGDWLDVLNQEQARG